MKRKPLLIILQVVLILAIIGGVIFFTMSTTNRNSDKKMNDSTQSQSPTSGKTSVYKVGVIQSDEGKDLTDTYNGFVSELKDHGFETEKNLVLDYNIGNGDPEKCRSIVKDYCDADYDLIFAVGEIASAASYETTKEIPIVFAAVSDPEELGIVESNENTNTNVTGVSDFIPCFEQMLLIKEVLPNAKSVGALYYKEDAGSLLQVSISQKQAQSDDMKLEYTAYPFEKTKDISKTVKNICKECDVVYLPVDKTVYSDISNVIDITNKEKKPVIGGDVDSVKAGALGTYAVNYLAVGKESAGIAADIMASGKAPSDIPVRYKHDCDLYLNKEAINLLGIDVPKDILDRAIII